MSLDKIESFVEYAEALDRCKDRYLICMAAKNTLSGMNDKEISALENLGIRNIRIGWNGYALVINQGEVKIDRHSRPNEAVLEMLHLPDVELQIVSRSWRAGNKAMIIINGQDLAVGTDGLNIVVFDKNTRMVVDSVCFNFISEARQVCKRLEDFCRGPVPEKEQVREEYYKEGFDIDEALGEIITKYNLDVYYPRYAYMKNSSIAIHRMSEEWEDTDNIACITVGVSPKKQMLDAMQFLKNISPYKRNQIDFLHCYIKNDSVRRPHSYSWHVSDFLELKQRYWKAYQHIYIISNSGSNFVGFWLRNNNVKYIGLYDYLAACNSNMQDVGLEHYEFLSDKRDSRFLFEDNFSGCTEWALYEEREKWSMYEDGQLGLVSAKKSFFLSIVLKDFVQAKMWLDRIIKQDDSDSSYAKAWREIEQLFDRIKLAFQERKCRDIIAAWVDMTSFVKAKEKMPFVSSMRKKSVWFDNMITMTAFTRETRRSMFTGKKLIDDETNKIDHIGLHNSPVLRLLYENGYRPILFETNEKMFDVPFISPVCLQPYDQGTPRYWEALRQILLSNNPCFVLIASMANHSPHYTSRLDDENILDSGLRSDVALKVADEQLEFYMNLVGDRTTSIVFSDHGNGDFYPRNHPFFFIYNRKINPKIVEGMCCNIDFYTILSQIMQHGNIVEEELVRDFVEIQGAPMQRARFAVKDTPVLQAAEPKYYPPFRGYKGVVTKDHVYIHFAGGREWLSRRDKLQPRLSWYARPDDICDESLLPEMRTKAGIDYGNEPLEYGPRSSSYLAVSEACEKNYAYNEKKLQLINNLITCLPDVKSALYLGDKSSQEAYWSLPLESRKKIACVISNVSDCACADLGLPIIPLDEVEKNGIGIILVTTRNMPSELKAYIVNQGTCIHVYGLYGWFEVNGYHTKRNFYDFAIQSMDAPLPSPISIPDFLHYTAPNALCEVSAALVVQNEKTLLIRLHDILKQVPLGIRIHCLDLTGKAAGIVKPYQEVDPSIEVIPVDGYDSLPMKMNELISSVNSKYIFFMSEDEYVHAKGLSYLHEIAEQSDADVVATGAVPTAAKNSKPSLKDFSNGSFELKKDGRLLPATYTERSKEWRTEIPSFAGSRLYRVDFLRKYGIRFQNIKLGWKDIFCLQTIFGSPKYVKVESPVCISVGNVANKKVEKMSAESAKELVESMFAYQRDVEALIKQWGGFGNNPALCDELREKAMTIFDRQYFSCVDLDEEMRSIVSQMLQEELKKNPSIGIWWIKYMFMRSSFPQSV